MALETELEVFAGLRQQLVSAHRGKFALIHGQDFLGAFDNVENAYREGVRKFGRSPFLVKRIDVEDESLRNFAYSLGLMHARL
jgi:hypothetical protein